MDNTAYHVKIAYILSTLKEIYPGNWIHYQGVSDWFEYKGDGYEILIKSDNQLRYPICAFITIESSTKQGRTTKTKAYRLPDFDYSNHDTMCAVLNKIIQLVMDNGYAS